jgi:hypothetical protein
LCERQILPRDDGIIAIGVITEEHRGGVDAGGSRHVERLHVCHGAGVDVFRDEGIERGGVIKALDLDLYAILIGPLSQESGFCHVVIRIPSGIDGPSHSERGFLLRHKGPLRDERNSDSEYKKS